MTIEQIKASDKTVLTPADVAEVLHAGAHDIRIAARQNPTGLGFPVVIIGTRIKIPKVPFLRFLGVDD